MSSRKYTASQRGKLVKVADKDSSRVYLSTDTSKPSTEFIDGPKTVGTATGYTYTDKAFTLQEVLRPVINPFLSTPTVETIYLIATDIELADNPAYDASKDTDRPKEEPEATSGPVDGSDTETADVSTTPGAGRVPVTAQDGKTVYVLVKEPATSTGALQTVQSVVTGNDPNRKWITYGLYGVLGLAVVALLVIVLRKPKPQQKLLPA